MKLFKCQQCGLALAFENRNCQGCGHVLGYLPIENELSALQSSGNGTWQVIALNGGRSRFCKNAESDACNWLIPEGSGEEFCIACRHNRTVPSLSNEQNVIQWRKMELAKHRLFYTLLRLNLPLQSRNDDPQHGLAFDFLADPVNGDKVMTGHNDGVITLALIETDDVARETLRNNMHEPYRTLLGHFRHEIGHYYWGRLVDNNHCQEAYRALFGDERKDYGVALKSYYSNGAPDNWQYNFVSAYATSHPWEDFAETWAHYLHIVDSLETSYAYGMEVHPTITNDEEMHAAAEVDPYQARDFEQLIRIWLPLTYALNAMNRSMGSPDLYPFILSAEAIRKLAFIHDLVHNRQLCNNN